MQEHELGAEMKTWQLSEKCSRSINIAQWNCAEPPNSTLLGLLKTPKQTPHPGTTPEWQAQSTTERGWSRPGCSRDSLAQTPTEIMRAHSTSQVVSWFTPQRAPQFFLKRLNATQDIQDSTMTGVGWNMKWWCRKKLGQNQCMYLCFSGILRGRKHFGKAAFKLLSSSR